MKPHGIVDCTCCKTSNHTTATGVLVDWSVSRCDADGVRHYSGLCPICFDNPLWKKRLGTKGWEHPAPTGKCVCVETKKFYDDISKAGAKERPALPTPPSNHVIERTPRLGAIAAWSLWGLLGLAFWVLSVFLAARALVGG